MHANSRPILSSRVSLHEHLPQRWRGFVRSLQEADCRIQLACFDLIIAARQQAGMSDLILYFGCGIGVSTRRLARSFPGSFVVEVDQCEDRLLARQIR